MCTGLNFKWTIWKNESDLPHHSRRIVNRNGTNEQCTQWRVGQKHHGDQGEPRNEGIIIQVLKSNKYMVEWNNGLEQVLCSGSVENMVTYHTNFMITHITILVKIRPSTYPYILYVQQLYSHRLVEIRLSFHML